MSSKAAKRRRKRAAKTIGQPDAAPGKKVLALRTVAKRQSMKPTAERKARGVWVDGKAEQPVVDLACDMIGALYQSRKISTSQEQAARLFQELRAGYLAELGTKGFGSCLADNQTGYDGGDGDAATIAAYRGLEHKIGRIKTACLIIECDKPADAKPWDIGVLRNSLDAVGA